MTKQPASYAATYAESLADPESFWLRAAQAVDWITEPRRALDASRAPFNRWFPDATLNTCHNAVDRHVAAGRGDQPAIHYLSPVTSNERTITYGGLLAEVQALAGALLHEGVGPGDRVLVYLPMIPEAVVAMLACARIGAVHSVVFGGFAAAELASRINDATPTVVLSASCGIEPGRTIAYKPLLDRALELAHHQPTRCIVKQRPEFLAELRAGRDLDWDEAVARGAGLLVPCVEVSATDPLYVLYTSGTTALPKGIVRDNGGHAVAMAWSLANLFDVGPGQVIWAASDVGWVVGHSYIVYAPLIAGATTILYEGKPVGTPDAGAFWSVVERYAVDVLFTAPTAIRAIRKEDPEGEYVARHDLSSLRTLFLAGERLDPATWEWATQHLGVPVVDNWWQTETGWPIAANPRGLETLPIKPGSPARAVPGFDIRILGDGGVELPAGEEGAICLRLPLPPGCLPTVWGDDARFVATYLSAFPGFYLTGDGGYLDEDGYLFVMGRTDDVINVAGHRLSTGAIEAVIARHPAVAECAVVGAADGLKGQLPRAFVTLRNGVDVTTEELTSDLVARVRDEIGAVASFRTVTVVSGLPKTRSGKILRKSIRELVDGRSVATPSTIEDPAALDVIRESISRSL